MTAAESAPEAGIAPEVPQYVTTAEILARLKISRTKFYTLRKRLAAAGRPVEPAPFGPRCVRWPETVVPELLEALKAAQP